VIPTQKEIFKEIVFKLRAIVLKVHLMFSILKRNGEKRKVKLSLFISFLISILY